VFFFSKFHAGSVLHVNLVKWDLVMHLRATYMKDIVVIKTDLRAASILTIYSKMYFEYQQNGCSPVKS